MVDSAVHVRSSTGEGIGFLYSNNDHAAREASLVLISVLSHKYTTVNEPDAVAAPTQQRFVAESTIRHT
jgi:hypothetical protein